MSDSNTGRAWPRLCHDSLGVMGSRRGATPREPAVEVRPREEVDGVLARRDRAADDLGVEVVVQLLLQAALDGEGLVQELAVEGLLGLVHEDARDALVVKLRPAGAAHHLEHVGHGEIDVALGLAVVELGPLNHDQVCGEAATPRAGCGRFTLPKRSTRRMERASVGWCGLGSGSLKWVRVWGRGDT